MIVVKNILLKLPPSGKFILTDQLNHFPKTIPRLMAEGDAKKHQKPGFQKYLDGALPECDKTIVSLEYVKDIYGIELCVKIIGHYDKSVRQLYQLAKKQGNFKNRRRKNE